MTASSDADSGGMPAKDYKTAMQKKKSYDKTSTERAKRFAEKIKEGGGASVLVRIKDSELVDALDRLVAEKFGDSRPSVLLKLLEERAAIMTRRDND